MPKLCVEKKMATSGHFPSSSGTNGYSGGESVSLTVETCNVGNLTDNILSQPWKSSPSW